MLSSLYTDDLLFWFKDEAHIHDLAVILHLIGIDLEQEMGPQYFLA